MLDAKNSKVLIGGLATACLILAIISIVLATMLYQKPRFAPTKSESPYVMFDNKTAQACWSGPPEKGWFEQQDPNVKPDVVLQRHAPNGLEFCKDLK